MPAVGDVAAIFRHVEPANALSLPTWIIHVSSLIEWLVAMGLIWEYADVTGIRAYKGLTWGMVPCHASGIAACRVHLFYNAPDAQRGGGVSGGPHRRRKRHVRHRGVSYREADRCEGALALGRGICVADGGGRGEDNSKRQRSYRRARRILANESGDAASGGLLWDGRISAKHGQRTRT